MNTLTGYSIDVYENAGLEIPGTSFIIRTLTLDVRGLQEINDTVSSSCILFWLPNPLVPLSIFCCHLPRSEEDVIHIITGTIDNAVWDTFMGTHTPQHGLCTLNASLHLDHQIIQMLPCALPSPSVFLTIWWYHSHHPCACPSY